MNVIRWLSSFVSGRGRALWKYRHGMAKANKHDYRGAISEYTAAIKDPACPIDVKGMATYNRALAYAAVDQDEKAAEDLTAMLTMPGLPESIKTQAHQRRERLRRRSKNADDK
jgi:hypothetical protein